MEAGSIVECIDDSFDERAFRYLKQMPVKGNLYLVRRIVYDSFFYHSERPGVLLEEIINPKRWFWSDKTKRDYLIEPRFFIWRFKEVQPPMDLELVLSDERESCLAK